MSKIPSGTVQAAQRFLEEREAVGLAKYGTTVDRTDLQAGDWLQHAIEEASDLLLYLIRLQQTMPVTAREAEAEMQRAEVDRAAYLGRWADAPAFASDLVQLSGGVCLWVARSPMTTTSAFAGHNLLGRVACEPRPEVQS